MPVTPAPSSTPAPAAMPGKPVETPKRTLEILPTLEQRPEASSFYTLLHASSERAKLSEKGPFTLFVPSQTAMKALESSKRESLLRPENRQELAEFVEFHAVDGQFNADELRRLSTITTRLGQRLKINASDKQLRVGDKAVVVESIVCSNGVIHIVDTMEVPVAQNLIQILEADGRCKKFVAAIEKSGYAVLFRGGWPVTIFAPTDEAIDALPPGEWEKLLKPTSSDAMPEFLRQHVAMGRVYSDQALTAATVTAASGGAHSFAKRDGKLLIGNAILVSADIDAKNGVVHVVDGILVASANQPIKKEK